MRLNIGSLCAIIAAVIFALAAVDSWPSDLADDLDAVPLGLAFLAAAIAAP